MLNLLKNSLFYRRCTILHSHLQSVRITFFFQLCWVFIAACRLFSSCSEWWLLSSCSAQASHCSGFSCCGAQALGCMGSVVVAHGLSCSVVCGIFQDQGSNSCLIYWRWILHQGSPGLQFFIFLPTLVIFSFMD